MNCKNCGNPLNLGQNFCPKCGVPQIYNNSLVTVGKENVSFNKKQKKVILSMMLLIIMLLIASTFFILNDNKLDADYNNSTNSSVEKRVRPEVNDSSRTIMIYMVGSNLESINRIASSEISSIKPEDIDLNKVNVLLYTGGTTRWHNFVQNDENAIYQLKSDGFNKIEQYDRKNMGDYTTLLEFLNYGYENFNTQYYELILYDHGGAIDGAIYDDFTRDNLSLLEFDKALYDSPFGKDNKLNTVLFRTCLNGTLEVASVFASYAEYLIASEEITNGMTGESVLNFINDIDDKDDGISYGKKFISAYEDQMDIIDPLRFSSMPMYSIIDLSKIEKVNSLLDEFISGIDLKANYNEIVHIRSNMYQYGYTTFNIESYDMVDLYTLVSNISKYSSHDYSKLLESIDESVVYNWSEEKNSKGLSVYFPYNANLYIQNNYLSIYRNLKGSSSYYNFINEFKSYSTSEKPSSFSKDEVVKNEISIKDGEAYLKLNEAQIRDYAQSIFIVFRKDEEIEGYYQPIYSSDNVFVENGILKTNISNNLIRIYNDNGEETYVVLVERGQGENKKLTTTARIHNYGEKSWEEADDVSVTAYFEIRDEIPSIKNYVMNESNGASGAVIDISVFSTFAFYTPSYKIFDDYGNYIPGWNRADLVTGYEFKISDMKFKLSTLEDGEYYCLFRVFDIYGNVYNSNMVKVQ